MIRLLRIICPLQDPFFQTLHLIVIKRPRRRHRHGAGTPFEAPHEPAVRCVARDDNSKIRFQSDVGGEIEIFVLISRPFVAIHQRAADVEEGLNLFLVTDVGSGEYNIIKIFDGGRSIFAGGEA